jgi:hypothetical protein
VSENGEPGDPGEPRRPEEEPGASRPEAPSEQPEPEGPAGAQETGAAREQTAAPGEPQASPRGGRAAAAFGRIAPSEWWGSAAVAGIVYGAMLVVTVLISLILLAVVRGEVGASLDAISSQGLSMVTDQFGAYAFIALIFQMVAMAMGGTLSFRLTQGGIGDSESITASLHAVPLLITLVGLTALFIASRMLARRQLRRGEVLDAPRLWISSAATAVMLTVLTVLLTLIFAGRGSFNAFIVSVDYGFNAMSFQVVILPLVVGTLVSFWARRSVVAAAPGRVREWMGAVAPGLGVAARLCGLYAGCIALLALIVFSIVSVVQGSPSAGFAMLFFGLPVVADALALGHLSGLVTKSAEGLGVERETAYIWSDQVTQSAGSWLMLIWIPIVLGILLLAVAWAGRRPRTGVLASWFVMPVVFLLLGFVLIWAGALRFSGGGFMGEGAYAFGPVWWTPLCLLIWGFVVEVLARFAAPAVLRLLPAGMRGFVAGSPAAAVAAGAAAGAGSAPASPAPAEATPMSPRTKKRLVITGIVAGSLVVLLALGYGGVRVVNATVYDPEKVVDEYLGAVVDGDVDRAVEIIDPNVASAERVLLTDAVYSEAGQRISDYEVDGVEVGSDGETAVADVSVTQDGRTTDQQLNLRKAGGSFGVVQWEIDAQQSGLYQTIDYVVPEGEETVTVNGTEVDVPEGSGMSSPSPTSDYGSSSGSGSSSEPRLATFTVLPGQYEFAAPSGGKYITYGSDQKVTAAVDGYAEPVAFDQKLTDAALTDARKAANAKLDECAQVREFEVAECGFDHYDTDRERNPQWSIETYPEYSLSNDSYTSLFSSSSGSDPDEVDPSSTLYLVTTKDGKAGLTYERRSYDDKWEDKDDTQSISGYFEVELSADQLELVDSTNSSGF